MVRPVMLNRAFVYMALAAFVAEAIGSHWVLSEDMVLMTSIGFVGAAVGMAVHELLG
jgi:hypothetical protein